MSKEKMAYLHENYSMFLDYFGWVEILIITLVSSQKSPTPDIFGPSIHKSWIIDLILNIPICFDCSAGPTHNMATLKSSQQHLVYTHCTASQEAAAQMCRDMS